MGVLVLLILAVYGRTLMRMAAYASASDLYSHVFLIPPISAYLLYQATRQKTIPYRSSPWVSAVLFVLAIAPLVAARAIGQREGLTLCPNDQLSIGMFSFVTFALGGVLLFFGADLFRAGAFAFLFLYFMVPLPILLLHAFNAALLQATAFALVGCLKMTGTPLLREGLTFFLPGLTIQVAEECSGVRSSFVLLITSLLAGQLFLTSPWRKTVLALAFFPIGAVRNALRILFISLVTIHVDPSFIHGQFHHRGGPFWFVLSLVPLFLILFILRKTERRKPIVDSP
jgi:exosortase C (VPDSG-CTERM-specific)